MSCIGQVTDARHTSLVCSVWILNACHIPCGSFRHHCVTHVCFPCRLCLTEYWVVVLIKFLPCGLEVFSFIAYNLWYFLWVPRGHGLWKKVQSYKAMDSVRVIFSFKWRLAALWWGGRKREFLESLVPSLPLYPNFASLTPLFVFCPPSIFLFKMSVTESTVPVFRGSGYSLSLGGESFPDRTSPWGLAFFLFWIIWYCRVQSIFSVFPNWSACWFYNHQYWNHPLCKYRVWNDRTLSDAAGVWLNPKTKFTPYFFYYF